MIIKVMQSFFAGVMPAQLRFITAASRQPLRSSCIKELSTLVAHVIAHIGERDQENSLDSLAASLAKTVEKHVFAFDGVRDFYTIMFLFTVLPQAWENPGFDFYLGFVTALDVTEPGNPKQLFFHAFLRKGDGSGYKKPSGAMEADGMKLFVDLLSKKDLWKYFWSTSSRI
jgi:hypothetical protein